MQIVWLIKAREQLKAVATYGQAAFGETAVIRFLEDIYKSSILLASFPKLGKTEPSLKGRNKDYRSLVIHKHYKIIYFIDNETVFIAAIRDTRSAPHPTP